MLRNHTLQYVSHTAAGSLGVTLTQPNTTKQLNSSEADIKQINPLMHTQMQWRHTGGLRVTPLHHLKIHECLFFGAR